MIDFVGWTLFNCSAILFICSNDWEFIEGGDFPSLDEGQQNDLEYTEFSVLPHRKNSFTGLVSGGTIERGKVKRKQKEIVDSIKKLSSSTDVKNDNLYFVRQPTSVTNAIQGNQVTFQCQIRGQKPIGKLIKTDVKGSWFLSHEFLINTLKESCKKFKQSVSYVEN